MDRLKPNTLLTAVLLSAMAVLAMESWLLWYERQRAHEVLSVLEQKTQDRARLALLASALNEEHEQTLAQNIIQKGEEVARLCTILRGQADGLLASSPPVGSTAAYFDIAAFVEQARSSARRAGIRLRPDEHFGFAVNAHEGPAVELIPAVFRQRILIQYLVEALVEAHPQELLGVQRERPLPEVQRVQRNQHVRAMTSGNTAAGHSVQADDFCEIDAQILLRTPGLVEGEAFRLEFSGQTPALRAFLNHLGAFNLPVVVRSVEVEPLGAMASVAVPVAPASPAADVLLVPQTLSKFTVVVELIQATGAGSTDLSREQAGRHLAQPAPAIWSEPAVQSNGAGWLYEIFTPPVIHYNPQSGAFTVMPPRPSEDTTPQFDLELLGVKREPYRLQLAGYYGRPGDYQAVFVSPGHAETMLVREGHRFADQGLTLKRFEVSRVGLEPLAGRPVFEVMANAILKDEATGAEVMLDNRTPKQTAMLVAVCRQPAGGKRLLELHEGEKISTDDPTCLVGRIQLDPPEVKVVRHRSGLTPPESKILRPVTGDTGRFNSKSARAEHLSPSASDGLANNNEK